MARWRQIERERREAEAAAEAAAEAVEEAPAEGTGEADENDPANVLRGLDTSVN